MKVLQALRKTNWPLVVLASALSIATAQASTVYTYTGSHYTAVFAGNVLDTTMSISGSITLAAPLISVGSFTNVFPTALDFSFTNGHDTLGPGDVNPARTQFQLQTDAAGNIIEWLVQLVTPVSVGAPAASVFSTDGGGDEGQTLSSCLQLASPGVCLFSDGFSDAATPHPGTWTIGTLAVPTTPLPAALPLFVTGFGAIGLFGWRRKKAASDRFLSQSKFRSA